MPLSAYVIHTRPFQDGKILIDLLTLEQGLIRGVWRLPKKEARVIPGPFLCFETECSGRNDLKTIKNLEPASASLSLDGLSLYSALYIHELIERLLPLNLPSPEIFSLYKWLIESLSTGLPIAPLLRRFEVGLFSELGMAINMATTSRGDAIQPGTLYQFQKRYGLRPHYGNIAKQQPLFFIEGQVALDYHLGKWSKKHVLSLAKELHRYWIDDLLNGKPVMARQLLPSQEFQGDRYLSVPIFRLISEA